MRSDLRSRPVVPTGVRRRAGLCAALIAAALASSSCNYEPALPELHFELSEETRTLGVKTGEGGIPLDVQAQIAGSLGMLFGTPANPRFLTLDAWTKKGFDPNFPQFPIEATDQGGGSGEIDPAELDQIHAENRKLFASELAAIDAGDFERARPPRRFLDLDSEIRRVAREVPRASRDDAAKADAAKSFVSWYPSLRESSELFRQQCVQCHGASGGGDGPTAKLVDPKPRDYRRGVFKFTAEKDRAMPRRADLYAMLHDGANGTSMPSFARFSRAELEGLVDYVRLLSIRGMVERDLAQTYVGSRHLGIENVLESYTSVWDKWQKSDAKYVSFDGVIPEATPERIAHGDALFHDAARGNCASCHGDRGRGDGPSAFALDEHGEKVPAVKDDWGNPIAPRDLTRALFRGGDRPIDIYRRIYAGINGTPMPGLGEAKDAQGKPLLSSDDLWCLVHYVRTLSAAPVALEAPGVRR